MTGLIDKGETAEAAAVRELKVVIVLPADHIDLHHRNDHLRKKQAIQAQSSTALRSWSVTLACPVRTWNWYAFFYQQEEKQLTHALQKGDC